MLDSNGSSSKEESQGTSQQDKMDIFSQAMASAEIDEFAANNSKFKIVAIQVLKPCHVIFVP